MTSLTGRRLLALLFFCLVVQPTGRTIRLGGTLPLSSAVERASLQGLQLLAARLNQSTPWNGPTNLPLKLHVQVEDDHGDPGKAAEIYARMLRKKEVDFLFGLHSSELFKVAVDAGNSANVLTLVSGGPHLLGPAIRPQLYSHWTFSPDVQVQDQMAGVLELVQHQEPSVSSVAMVWDGGSAFDKEMCTGASSHAQRLGMEVLDNMSVAEQAIMPQMRQLKAAGPDLLIACGNLRSAEQILVSASALGFIPRGIALTAVSTREAVRSIGAHLANYVLSPLTWEPSSSQSCPVFGSARDFADAYRSKFGEEPLPASAAAAAGGIALLAAVKTASSLEQAAVREALLAQEQQTCYGRLAFSLDGLRQNPTTLVQQVQPLDEDQPKMDRWTSSQIVTVGQEQPVTGWPLPTWAQKEIDVYPCNPGQAVVLDIGGNATTCAECPAGRFRTPRSVECEDCQPGTYGMQPGMSQCDVCPSGAACPGNSEVVAKPGFYQLPAASLEGAFVPCYPPQLCIGKNQCAEAHHGILCQSCELGFSKPLWGLKRDKCSKCPSQRVTIGSIVLTISVYVLYIWLIVKGTKSASQSMRALPSVILKIGVNYMQFAGTAFEATNFKGMVSAVCGEASASWIFPVVALPERLQYPLTTLMSLDCILPEESDVRPYQVEILVGLFLMPAAFFIMTIFAFIRKDCIGQRLMPWLRRQRARYKARRQLREAELGVIQEAAQEEEGGEPSCRISVPLSPSSGASPTRRDARTPTSPTSPNSLRGEDYPLTPMSAYGTASPASPWRHCRTEDSVVDRPRDAATKILVNSVAMRFINSVIVMSFILHPVVVRILVVGFECEELDVLRHRHDLGVECKSTTHMQWLCLSTVGLVVYGIGVPVALFIALFRVRKRLFHAEVRKRFGFLYNGFELRYYYFESVYMFRKVMILLFFTAPTMYVRMVLMLFTSFGFILLHVYSGPFDNRSYLCLDRLEALNLLALTVTVSARLIFDIRQELSGEFFEDFVNHWTMDIVLVAGPLLAHAAFIWFALWSLFRNTVLKHLLLKADIWPEKMSRLQKCLLGLEIHKQKAAFDEDERGLWIDTSSLSKQERHYMFVAMCDTLHRYMNSSKRVHPGDVTAAIQEALIRCRRARRKRAVRLEQLDREFREQRQHGRRGCLSRLIRWQRVMNISLYGDRHTELQEQEPGCIETLLKWAVSDTGRRVRGLPQKALHMEMEQTHEFLAEEFYDALLPVWQEITEGRGPQVPPQYEDRGMVRSMSQLVPQRRASCVEASEGSGNQDGEKEDPIRSVSGSLHGSSMRLEALLGRTQPLQTDRSESGGLERFLCRARSGCRVELPDLLRAHDELMAENLHLRRENEALRARPTSPQQVSPGTRSGYASPTKSHRTEVSPSARMPSRFASEANEASSEEVPVNAAVDDDEEEAEIPEEGSQIRRSCWRDQAPSSPSLLNAAAAAFVAATSLGRSPKAQTRPEDSRSKEPWVCAMPLAPEAPPAARKEEVKDVRPPSPQRLAVPSAKASAPVPSKALLRLPVPSAAERARSMCAEVRSRSPNSATSGSPWRKAMRPTKNAAWLKQAEKDLSNRSSVSGRMVPFEFMGAARPTNPAAWPQVE